MRKTNYYIAILSTVIPMAAACSDKVAEPEGLDSKIEISAGFTDTKAPLNNSDLGNGSEIKLYDILDENIGYAAYLDGLTATKSADKWDIAGAPLDGYSWKYNNQLYDHHFFGWLTRDNTGMSYNGVFMNGSTPVVPEVHHDGHGIYTWSVGEVPMRFTYDQFDFCYSNIVTRTVEKPDYTRVNLSLTHLFTALGVSFHNYDSAPITVKKIRIYGLTNVKSASIRFDTNTGEVTPTYNGNHSQSRNDVSQGLDLIDAPITIPADGDVKNVITTSYAGGKSASEETFFLMWPQDADELPYCKLAVQLGHMANDEWIELSMKPIGAPADYSWETGTKHHVELAARGKKLQLKVTPMPWDKQSLTLDDTESIICNSAGKVEFNGTTCTIDDVNKRIYFHGGNPIKFNFKLDSPKGATWMVKMEGDIDAFEVDNAGPDGSWKNYGDEANTPSGMIDDSTAWVTIYPRNLDPDKDYQIKISIVVRTSTGRLLVDDEQVLGKYKDYTIVQQAS